MKSISTFVIAFLIIGFFFLALPEKGYSGINFGCCKTMEVGGRCIGCETDCSTSENFCNSQDTHFFDDENLLCINFPDFAICESLFGPSGCCITESGDCIDDLVNVDCFEDDVDGEIWVSATQCEDVPQCEVNVVSAVPTLSEWALIAMAGILAIVGFMVIRRRKAAVKGL